MKYLDLSFPDPSRNLACDEALLELCEEGYLGEILRFWESDQYFVVAGYSNKISREVNLNSGAGANIQVLRRISGGGTILQGPGCLNYALILNHETNRELKDIVKTTCFIMNQHKIVFEKLLSQKVEVKGTSDLVMNNLKFSGNAQRRKKRFTLFHGTFLIGMDLKKIEKHLLLPSREPDYRKKRAHKDFLTNLNLPSEKIKKTLTVLWKAQEKISDFPGERIQTLCKEKYSKKEWNFKF